MQGGTFTITNPGNFGAQFGLPIINQPQVAILGVGAIEKRAVVIDDAIAIRPMGYLTLGFDHRLVDGAVADQFMAQVKRQLENFDAAGRVEPGVRIRPTTSRIASTTTSGRSSGIQCPLRFGDDVAPARGAREPAVPGASCPASEFDLARHDDQRHDLRNPDPREPRQRSC